MCWVEWKRPDVRARTCGLEKVALDGRIEVQRRRRRGGRGGAFNEGYCVVAAPGKMCVFEKGLYVISNSDAETRLAKF